MIGLFNLARRNVRRSWRHQIIVVFLIAIPVGLGVFTAIGERSIGIDGRQNFMARYGSSDFGLIAGSDVTDPGDLAAVMTKLTGAGAELLVYRSVVINPGYHEVTDVDLGAPLAGGLVADFEGRAPERLGEVVVSTATAERLGVGLGHVMPPAFGQPTTVVGIVRPVIDYEQRIYLPAGSLADNASAPEAEVLPGNRPRTTIGVSGLSRQELDAVIGPFGGEGGPWLEALADQSQRSSSVGATLGAFISAALLVEVALLAAASFAIRSRRRVVEFGRLSAVGATPEQIRSLVLVEAVVVALVGSAVGMVVAVSWAVLAPSHAGALLSFIYGDPETVYTVVLNPIDWVWPPLFAVFAALAAAVVPARTASRLSVAQALASGGGRDELTPRLRSTLLAAVVGFSLIGLTVAADSGGSIDGVAITIMLFAGVVSLVLAAAGAASAALVWLDRAPAGRLPISLRLAVRDSARHRLRSVMALTAAGLIIGVAVTAMTLAANSAGITRYGEGVSVAMLQTESPAWIDLTDPTGPPADRAEVAKRLGFDPPIPLTGVGSRSDEPAVVELRLDESSPGDWVQILVADADGEIARELPAAARNGLNTPGSLVELRITDADPIRSPAPPDQATLDIGSSVGTTVPAAEQGLEPGPFGRQTATLESIGVELIVVEVDGQSMAGQLARLGLTHLVSPATVESLDLPTVEVGGLIVGAAPFTDEEVAALSSAAVSLPRSFALFGSQPTPVSGGSQLIALAVVAALVILIYRLLAGLIAVDTDEAVSTMLALGAPNRLRQTHLAGHAFLHLSLAVVLSVPMALVAAEIVDRRQVFFNPLVVPWTLLVGLLALPIAGAAFVAGSTKSGVIALSRRAT